MKTFASGLSIVLLSVCCICQSRAQDDFAPLYLFTSGSGSITPYQNGQLLEVGTNYEMTAVPNSGFTFGSWQPANIFVSTVVLTEDPGGSITNTTTYVSLLPEYTTTASLTFTMQAFQVIIDDPGVRTLTENFGWQANFVAIPEPSIIVLVTCGFLTVSVFPNRTQRDRSRRRSGGQLDGADNLSATPAAGPEFPPAVADLNH